MTCSVGNPGVKGWGTLLILLCSSVAVPVRCASWDSSLNSRVLGVRATASPVLYPVQLNLQPAAQPSAHHLAGWHALAAQQQVANAGGSAGNRGSNNPHDPQYTWHRRRLHESGQQLSADGSERLEAWLQNSTWIRTYQNGSCFPSGRVHQAANVRDLIRFVKDKSVNQIQLVGNIVFSHDLFPPENSNDRTKGVNASTTVEIRACTSRDAPIIIDCNNIFRQFYIDGSVTWRGSIKFINSYPSPRRGDLWELPSPLSIEDAGQIHFKGVHVHGYENSALFNEADPFWEVHNDSRFAPQPGSYERLTPTAMIMKTWLFNRTAWLLHSQGAHGLVRSTGDGYWLFEDVLFTFTGESKAAKRGVPVLAVALPVVFGVLVLVGMGVLAWLWTRKISRPPPSMSSKSVSSRRTPQRSVNFAGLPGSPPGSTNSFSGLPSTVGVESSGPSATCTKDLIEATRQRMRQSNELPEGALVLQGMLGEGAFGKVYSAMWKGTLVAVKTMLLPAAMSGKERREKMAIMETAISSSLSHPNIVQLYTYEVKGLSSELSHKGSTGDSLSASGPASSLDNSSDNETQSTHDYHGWEVRLVLELCDLGTLQELLAKGGFKRPTGQYDMAGLIATAQDVARAMHHLHTENIIHGDLKARNVLLKSAAANTKIGTSSAGGDARGFVAKVSDFGLSTAMDPTETHISNFYQGTLNHMAPEVLMYGKISFASDVYAYGIVLWEMYTAQQAYKGVAKVLLGHEVAKLGRRPEFPPDCPFDFQLLACRCWESDPAIRPTFEQILSTLQSMIKRQHEADSASSLLGTLSTVSSCSTQPAPMQGHLGHPRNAARLRAASATAATAAAAAAVPGAQRDAPNAGGSPPALQKDVFQGSSISEGSTGSEMRAVMPVGAGQAGELELQQPRLRQQQKQQGEVDMGQLQDSADRPGAQHKLLKALQQQQRANSIHHSSCSDLPQLPGSAAADDTAMVCAAGGAAAAAAAAGAGTAATAAAALAAASAGCPSSQLQPDGSLGTWDGEGLWLSGSLAPVELQQGQGIAPAQRVPGASQGQLPNGHQQQQQRWRLQQVQGDGSAHHLAAGEAGRVAVARDSSQPGVSLGTWDGDGLWLSGSLAPVEVQQSQGTTPAQISPSATQEQQDLQQQRLQQVQGCGLWHNPAKPAGSGEASSQLQRGVSLGTWDYDGLSLPGSLAPVQGEAPLVEMPGDGGQNHDHHLHQQQLLHQAVYQWQQQQQFEQQLLSARQQQQLQKGGPTQPAATGAYAAGAPLHTGGPWAADATSAPELQAPNGVSGTLGTWEGDGLWPSGSLAPVEVQELKQHAAREP